MPERELVEIAVRSLGLDQVAPFDPAKKIIEYHFKPAAPLMSMTASRFVDEVSTESPAPGGGSVAALMGSLAAALATMVANLTVGKKGYEEAWDEMAAMAERGQAIKDRLARAVDLDTDAFNRVMEAMRLPKGTPEEQAERTARSRRPTSTPPTCRWRRCACAWTPSRWPTPPPIAATATRRRMPAWRPWPRAPAPKARRSTC